MAVPVVCTSCGSNLKAPDTTAGRVVKCPKCGGRVVVPPICSVATSPRPARKVHGPAPASAKSAMSVRRAQNKQLPASPGPVKASSRVDVRLWVVSLVFILLVVGGAAAVYIFDPFAFRASSMSGLDASAGGGANTPTTPVKPSPGADLVSPVDKDREKRTTDLVARGKQLIAQRKLDEAWQCYKDASVIKPEDPRVQELRKLVEEARVKPATEPPKTVEMPKPDESPQATAADPKPVPLFNNNTRLELTTIEADGAELIKYATGVLKDDLAAGSPTKESVARALEADAGKKPTDKEVANAFDKETKQYENKLKGVALFIAATAQTTKGDAQKLATVCDAALKLQDSLAKRNYVEAKMQVAALPDLRADPKATVQPVALEKIGGLNDWMYLLKLRRAGGFGFTGKSGQPNTDGMEARMLGLSRKALSPMELETQADDIVRLANINAVLGQVAAAFTPTKADPKKDPKVWKQTQEDMVKFSLALAAAARKKDAKETLGAAKGLNTSCTDCHEVFR